MIYRAQFAYPRLAGCQDEQFSHYFDKTNTPSLGTSIPAGGILRGITLQLDRDAPFSWRATKMDASVLSVQLQDPWGNFLENDYTPVFLYLGKSGSSNTGALPIVYEPGIDCPAGGVILVNFYNSTALAATPPPITLLGIKRRDPSMAVCQ